MKNLPIALLILLSIVVETTLVSYPTTAVVLTIAILYLGTDDIWLIFLSGIIFDLFSQRLLGLSSLFFISLYLIFSRYKKKFHGGRQSLRLLLTGAIVCIYSLLFSGFINWKKIVVAIALAAFLLFLVEKYFVKADRRRLTV